MHRIFAIRVVICLRSLTVSLEPHVKLHVLLVHKLCDNSIRKMVVVSPRCISGSLVLFLMFDLVVLRHWLLQDIEYEHGLLLVDTLYQRYLLSHVF